MADHVIRRGVQVPMRDGALLSADVWLPAAEGTFPALLQRTPYGREPAAATQTNAGMENLRALAAGFAIVVQDTRGRFGSTGRFEPFRHEADDGVDTIAWLREQDFCDGRVAMYGASYVGATQLLVATRAPEGLLAMAPVLTSGSLRDPWAFSGGALQLGFLWLWLLEGLAPPDLDHRDLPGDHPARAWLTDASTDPVGAMSRLPLLDGDALDVAPWLESWTRFPTDEGRWAEIETLPGIETCDVRALHVAGLHDIFVEGSLRTFTTLREHGATASVRDGQYLVLGPWSHGNTGDWQGERWHGYAAALDDLDLPGMQLDFFRCALDGTDPELPRVRFFVSGTDTWHEAADWPPPSRKRELHLGADGVLSATAPLDAGTLRFTSDPADPVPTTGGRTYLPGVRLGRNSGPRDQADVESRPDVLVLRSDTLPEGLTVVGPVHLELWAESTAQDCDWTARLVDVGPTGVALGVADGVLRCRYRHGETATPLAPGRTERFVVELGTVAHHFAPGHRVGLQVASSNFPRFDRNPQCMVDPVLATADDLVVAQQTVHCAPDRASRLVLPVMDLSERVAS